MGHKKADCLKLTEDLASAKDESKKKKSNPSKGDPKGAGAGKGDKKSAGEADANSKYGAGDKGKKRSRESPDPTKIVCWRCGQLGHRTNDKITGIKCTATRCTKCTKSIGAEKHDARVCMDAKANISQSSDAKRART